MAHHTSADETKLLQMLERLPFSEEDKKQWSESISTGGLNEGVIKEIQAKMAELPTPEEHQVVNRTRDTASIATLIKRWRLSENLRGVRGR